MNKDKTSELNIWVGDAHHLPDANKLLLTLAENIDIELNFLSISGPSPINARIFNV
jgi:hypothetical protein